jgi:Leucine rich repeat variant
MVSRKRKLDSATLGKLSKDSDEAVRAGVARNPATPLPILERMLDEWAEVRSIAAHRLGRGTASSPGDIGER